jgi:hypothetical protein
MVRSTLLQGEHIVDPQLARNLLQTVRIRGGFLQEPPPLSADDQTDTTALNKQLNPLRLRVRAPADVRFLKAAEGLDSESTTTTQTERLLGSKLLELDYLETSAGVSWPALHGVSPDGELEGDAAGSSPYLPSALVVLPERVSGHKLQSVPQGYWPLSLALYWNLGCFSKKQTRHHPEHLELLLHQLQEECSSGSLIPLLAREQRMHVVLEDERKTAEAGQLFSSGGLRLREGWKLVLEVENNSPQQLPPGLRLTLLGGESRSSYLEVDDLQRHQTTPGLLPPFDRVDELYQTEAHDAGGLRLQLLTPAFLPASSSVGPSPLAATHGAPAWLPSWLVHAEPEAGVHPALKSFGEEGITLKLKAVCLQGMGIVSGWNLQGNSISRTTKSGIRQRTGTPREVRRLVPAGTVYFFDILKDGSPLPPSELQRYLPKLCRALWGGFLDPHGPGEALHSNLAEFRAPASFDGYGQILPGYWKKSQLTTLDKALQDASYPNASDRNDSGRETVGEDLQARSQS